MSRGEHASREGRDPEPAPTRPAGDAAALTVDELFEVLGNKRRRYAFYYLAEGAGTDPVDITDVSSQVAAWELDADPEEITYADRKNVHTSLFQFHVPKMEDLGLVEYDPDERTVRLTEAGADLDLYGGADGADDRWSGSLLLLSAATVLVAAGAWLDLSLLSTLPDGAVGLAGAGLFLLSAAAFRYHTRTSSESPRRVAPVPERPDR
jgi:hypothetical protein